MEQFLVSQKNWISSETMNLLKEDWVAIPNWKWIALAIIFVLGFLGRPVLQYVFSKIKNAPTWKRATFFAYLQQLNTEAPLAWIFTCLFWITSVDSLALGGNLHKYLTLLVQIILVTQVIRLLYVSVDAVGRIFHDLASKTETTLDDQLVPMAVKTLKLVIIVMGVLIALQNFGLNVASILAGLGLGGLAFALAAKDTAANVFGSITILLDAPFKIGDTIKIGDTEGSVEDIGFRSTRIRTLYNSLVTIPNSVVANEKIDNTGVRAKRRVRQILSLTYETPPAKIEEFCKAVATYLEKTEKVDHDSITVTFNNFNAASLDVLLNFHLAEVNDVKEEQLRTQRVFIDILQMAEKMKVDFAYPTQTLYLKGPLETQTKKEMTPEPRIQQPTV